MRIILTVLIFLITTIHFSQNLQPFKIFTKEGKEIKAKKLFSELNDTDIILFGEYHDNSIIHWIQLQFVKEFNKKQNVIVGMEMLESDNQYNINEYLKSKINQAQLDTLTRLWPNYKTDYKPIVDFAKENNIPVIATNVPRRYASILYKNGEQALINLPEFDKQWIAPLPMIYNPNLKSYKDMLKMFGDGNHTNKNFPKSQALKDYTMAYFILKNFKEKYKFIHLNGSYHSNNFEGIYWYLKHEKPHLKIKTISTVLQKDIAKLSDENKNLSNYIIVTDLDITRTH